ncbi:MAG: T9SS type A sorting domain-containing protein [Aequorivita sp.]|nr:T9SS type A sorting domain-containing protein [Aequorivita sp.]
MKIITSTVLLFFCLFQLHAQQWNQLEKVVSPDRTFGDQFGGAIAIQDNIAVISAPYEWDEIDPATGGGRVYIFERNMSGEWINIQKIGGNDIVFGDNFGNKVAIAGDYIAIAAYLEDHNANGAEFFESAGSVYIFKKQASGLWQQSQKLVASDRDEFDYFGFSIAMSGEYLVVGANEESSDENGNNFLGASGSAYVFKRSGNIYSETQKIVATDRSAQSKFGSSVTIDDDFIVVGSPFDTYDIGPGNIEDQAGSAYVFQRNGNDWNQTLKIVPDDRNVPGTTIKQFGTSVSLDAGSLIVGAPSDNSVYFFENDSNQWSQIEKFINTNSTGVNTTFGFDVSISGNFAFVGAPSQQLDASGANNIADAGAIFLFGRNNGNWAYVNQFDAIHRNNNDRYGTAVAIDQEYAFGGSPKHRTDVNGQNPQVNAGATFLIEYDGELGLPSENLNSAIVLFPNPSHGELTIELPQKLNVSKIKVTDILSREVYNTTVIDSTQVSLDLALNSGVYIVQFFNENTRLVDSKKIIIK